MARRPDLDAVRRALPVDRPASWLAETEPDSAETLQRVLTVFLTNRECPWRCLMCDLWKHTTLESVPPGAIPRQLQVALAAAPPARWLKLYNAGSFFDVGAIPAVDQRAMVELCRPFGRLVVECHPALVGPRVRIFCEQLGETRLEVAMGLETVHPEVLPRLNKRMTTEEFRRAAAFLRANAISVRAFVLVQPPFLKAAEALEWAVRSAAFAFDSGAEVVSLIPTRAGNGALEELARRGEFREPTLGLFEKTFEECLRLERGRIFADLWDLERFGGGEPEFQARRARLEEMNRRQCVLPAVVGAP